MKTPKNTYNQARHFSRMEWHRKKQRARAWWIAIVIWWVGMIVWLIVQLAK